MRYSVNNFSLLIFFYKFIGTLLKKSINARERPFFLIVVLIRFFRSVKNYECNYNALEYIQKVGNYFLSLSESFIIFCSIQFFFEKNKTMLF